jgi:hypothetical protein
MKIYLYLVINSIAVRQCFDQILVICQFWTVCLHRTAKLSRNREEAFSGPTVDSNLLIPTEVIREAVSLFILKSLVREICSRSVVQVYCKNGLFGVL